MHDSLGGAVRVSGGVGGAGSLVLRVPGDHGNNEAIRVSVGV